MCSCLLASGENWLRGLDLNQRSRSRGIMSRAVSSPLSDKIRRLLRSEERRVGKESHPQESLIRFSKTFSRDPFHVSTSTNRSYADQSFARHPSRGRYTMWTRDFS